MSERKIFNAKPWRREDAMLNINRMDRIGRIKEILATVSKNYPEYPVHPVRNAFCVLATLRLCVKFLF